MVIFHNIPLHYNLSVEETTNFFQTLWTSETRVTWEHTVPAFIPSAFWPVHWATRTRTLLTFSVPSGALSPVLANPHLYYRGSNWQGCKSQGTRPIAFPAACGCMWVCICRQTLQWLLIIKTVIWRSGCLLSRGYRNYSLQWSSSESASIWQMAFPGGRPPSWFPQCGSSPARASHTNVPPHLHLQ